MKALKFVAEVLALTIVALLLALGAIVVDALIVDRVEPIRIRIDNDRELVLRLPDQADPKDDSGAKRGK